MAVPVQRYRIASSFGGCSLFNAITVRIRYTPAARSVPMHDNAALGDTLSDLRDDNQLGLGHAGEPIRGSPRQPGWYDVSNNRYWFFACRMLFLHHWSIHFGALVFTGTCSRSCNSLLHHVDSVAFPVSLIGFLPAHQDLDSHS